MAVEQKAGDQVREATADALVAQADAAEQEREGEREHARLDADAKLAEVQAEQAQQEAERVAAQLDRS
jgi:hypothetical protein